MNMRERAEKNLETALKTMNDPNIIGTQREVTAMFQLRITEVQALLAIHDKLDDIARRIGGPQVTCERETGCD